MDRYFSLAKIYDSFSLDVSAEKWADYVHMLLKNGGLGQGSKIVDVGCGTGKITLELYKKGYSITAADSSETMLDMASERFAGAGAAIQIICQDIKNINIHGKASAVVCTNDVINYLIDEDDIVRAFSKTYDILGDGGVFLFDISSKNKLKAMHDNTYFEENDEGLYIWRNEYDAKKNTLWMDISLYCHLRDDLYEKSLETHVQKGHEIANMKKLLTKSGFSDINCYNCFTLDPPAKDSSRIQFSAVKQKT